TSAPACGGADVRVRAAWTAADADRVRGALAPWGDRVALALDASVATWRASYLHVCEATRVRGEQSDRLLEVRMQCLDRALDRTATFARALDATASATERAAAVVAAQALPDPAVCEHADSAAVMPEDP